MKIQEVLDTSLITQLEIRKRISKCNIGNNTRLFLIRVNNISIGYIALDIINNASYLEVYELYIIKNRRKRGFGSKAMCIIEEFAINHGYSQIRLFPHPIDDSINYDNLIKWYLSLGFAINKNISGEYIKFLLI